MNLPVKIPGTGSHQRLRLSVRGRVQGVGFRPFVYRLARQCGLAGWVQNTPWGVRIEVEGCRAALDGFFHALERGCPPPASIQGIEPIWLEAVGFEAFEIKDSEQQGSKAAVVLPDLATCADCLRELFDPADRRHRYPFINCTQCGPRYSIIRALPYDRPNTSMHSFVMCTACQAEYESVEHRRFHAQPNACPECGPHLEWWDGQGRVLASHDEALARTVQCIRQGGIAAVKGLGGFHLICDATQPRAVGELRRRKRRPSKPFALLFPSLESVEAVCVVSAAERRLLLSPEAPIVLLRLRKNPGPVAAEVAPGHPHWGVMLPSNPLHHLLTRDLDRPLVATSGNLADETLCYDEIEALQRLAGLADGYLVHNRPIVRHVDDSIVRVVAGREQVLRRARGLAPLPIATRQAPSGVLAVGGHLKNSVALSLDGQTILSQHIGDLDTGQSRDAQAKTVGDLALLFDRQPEQVVTDAHPDYASTRFAETLGLPVEPVQHHVAHVWSCMTENEIPPPVLGVAWDGSGLGPDGTLWGGEFLRVTETGCERLAHLRTFPLPGGEPALREPRRAALGLLFAHLGDALLEREDLAFLNTFQVKERALLHRALRRKFNCPETSSLGRLFDAAAALMNLKQVATYEGEAAALLEFAVDESNRTAAYPFRLDGSVRPWVLDWALMLEALLADLESQAPLARMAAAFHNGLIDALVQVAVKAGEQTIALSGGCFQNRVLTEKAVSRLGAEGFRVCWHQRVPPNDGGLALGQVAAAGSSLKV